MITRATRFYKPINERLTDDERMFARGGASKKYGPGGDFDFTVSDSAESFYNAGQETFDQGMFGADKFQITYHFSSAIRKNKFSIKGIKKGGIKRTYGAPNMSFKELYELLCEGFNGGVFFIDTYFEKVFKTRPVFQRYRALNERIAAEIDAGWSARIADLPKKKDGTPDKRFTAYKEFIKNAQVWQDSITYNNCSQIAGDIRHDIVVCLSTGRLPLRGVRGARVNPGTERARAKLAGMVHPNRLFYASGQLIHGLNIVVEMGSKAA